VRDVLTPQDPVEGEILKDLPLVDVLARVLPTSPRES